MSNPSMLRIRIARVKTASAIVMMLLSSNLLPGVRAIGGDLDTTFGKDGKVTTNLGGGGGT